MAVAGLHNVSVFDSSFLRESESPVSRRWSEQDRPSTRASSVLQMWLEIEAERVVSHPNGRFGQRPRRQGSDTSDSDHLSTQGSVNGNDSLDNGITVENENGLCCHSLVESENEHEDGNSFCSEQSTDLGEIERERVRRIFNEWMCSGVKSHSPNASHRNNRSRAHWLGENECGRVRIIREWVQMNSQQRGTCVSPRDEGVAEIGSQIEQARDEQLVNRCEIVERRPIRRFCGRQALLDLLKKAQMERKKELQDLLECRRVANFPHRNRIQSLLRGRFLLNGRLVQDERPSSTAASELGLLRQRHTVSDLREGFISRLDRDAVHGVQTDASSTDEIEDRSNEQSQSNNEQEVREIYDQSEHGNGRIEIYGTHSVKNTQCSVNDDVNDQEYSASVSEVSEAEEQVLVNEEQVQATSSVELISGGHDREDDATRSWGNEQQISDTDSSRQSHLAETYEAYNENDGQSNEASHVNEAESHMYGLEGSTTEEPSWQGMSVHEEEWQEPEMEHEENTSMQLANAEISEWTEVNIEGTSGIWQEGTANQWYQETSGNDIREQNHMQESDEEWHGNVLQDAIDSWLDVPSGEGSDSFRRVDSFYFPDEENIHNMELRELVSRRRVSTLLRSGFRESLDQLIQSYVQRQNHASVDWELDGESLPPAFIDQEQEQDQEQDQNDDQDEGQPAWDPELQNVNWPDHHAQQQTGNEWEIINELRIDMARLQQRMNNMQNMLETCMDMQLELQRSVRQEVSAALNRAVISADACKDNLLMGETKWDHVRKGICCMCCDNNIDSLLYRCGHMCTCSKCAEELVQGGKCPMCLAPVIEVIRAYFIQ